MPSAALYEHLPAFRVLSPFCKPPHARAVV